jgi:hypothetical protein
MYYRVLVFNGEGTEIIVLERPDRRTGWIARIVSGGHPPLHLIPIPVLWTFLPSWKQIRHTLHTQILPLTVRVFSFDDYVIGWSEQSPQAVEQILFRLVLDADTYLWGERREDIG